MSQITVEFDNTLQKSDIIVPLLSSSKAEGNDTHTNEYTDKAQTAVFGIKVPLIMINATVIDFNAVQYFELKSEGKLPELTMIVEDRYELITNIDKPGLDNEVRVQILPRFDDAYKKIDLTFYISNIKVTGSMIRLSCVYKLSPLMSSKFEALGELDTYTLFRTSGEQTGLGFATNVGGSKDNRFIYFDNKSWLDILDSEINYSNTTDHILDWWVDLWDNVNLVDIKERYEAIDSNDDMMIWVSGQTEEVTVDVENTPIQVPAVIHNNPINRMSELFVKNYSIDNLSGSQVSMGSDKLYGVYEESKGEYLDYLLQDGDVKNDIFTKYKYIGESYGEYNYLLAKQIRLGFLQKMNTERIKVTLNSPLLGLMRGHKVNFIRYINDDKIENKIKAMESAEIIDRNVESNIPLSDYEIEDINPNGSFRIDKTVSAQYLITGINIKYNNNAWDYVLTLVKPAQSKVSIIKEE